MSPAEVAPRRVLFGYFAEWIDGIRSILNAGRYDAAFEALDAADLAAFDAVVPLQEDHYPTLAARPELRGRRFLHPDPEVVAVCADKLALAQRLVALGHGAHVPMLRAPGPPYPYVWKRREGAWGRQVRVVHGPANEAVLDLSDPAWFAQALAFGTDEFALHLLRAGGRIVYAATAGYRMAGPDRVRGAREAPVISEFNRGAAHLELFERILGDLAFEGTACINYKVVDGRPLILEINPRFGASLATDINGYLDAYLAALRP